MAIKYRTTKDEGSHIATTSAPDAVALETMEEGILSHSKLTRNSIDTK